MAGLDSLIDYIPQLAPVANALGFTKTVPVAPELPSDIQAPVRDIEEKNPLYGLPNSTIPADLPQRISAYRADPTGRYGGKDGLETRPLSRLDVGGNWIPSNKGSYHMYEPNPDMETSDIYTNPTKAVQQLYRFARTNGAAASVGVTPLPAEDLAAFVLKEGRTDLGLGGGSSDKSVAKLNEDLQNKYMVTPRDRDFLTKLASKQSVATRLKIPFAMAWNGTGVNEAGQSGADYAKNWEAHKQAALHEKNQQLMDVINRGIADGQKYGFPLRENKDKDTRPSTKQVPYKKGGAVQMPKTYTDGNWKLI